MDCRREAGLGCYLCEPRSRPSCSPWGVSHPVQQATLTPPLLPSHTAPLSHHSLSSYLRRSPSHRYNHTSANYLTTFPGPAHSLSPPSHSIPTFLSKRIVLTLPLLPSHSCLPPHSLPFTSNSSASSFTHHLALMIHLLFINYLSVTLVPITHRFYVLSNVNRQMSKMMNNF